MFRTCNVDRLELWKTSLLNVTFSTGNALMAFVVNLVVSTMEYKVERADIFNIEIIRPITYYTKSDIINVNYDFDISFQSRKV